MGEKKDGRRVVGYIRASKEEQTLTPEAQLEAMRQWAEAQGAELVAVYQDHGISGGDPVDKRPGLLEAIEALSPKGATVLLVAKRDRLARDLYIAAVIERLVERKKAQIMSADGTGNGNGPEDMLMKGIKDLFAQYERALIKARTKAALAVKKRRGEVYGEVPFGYRREGDRLVEDPAGQEAIEIMLTLRADGMTYQQIADELKAMGVPTRKGGKWEKMTVQRIVKRCAA